MKKTLHDIADATGYSVTTVSRALNRSTAVAPQVRSVILNYARQIGYMQGKRTVIIIVPSLSLGIYYQEMLFELCNMLDFAGLKMEMVPINSLELIEERNLCGAISIMAEDGLERYWGKQQAIPLVCLNTRPRHLDGIFTVASNEVQGTRLVTKHLIDLGHRRICLITPARSEKDANYCQRQRFSTFKTVMMEHGLYDYHICHEHWSEEESNLLIKKALDAGVTAFISSIEGHSARLTRLLNLMGKRVPADISLIGWLDENADSYCTPPITGIRQNFNYLAKHVMVMFNKLLHKEPVTEDVIVDYNFFPGNSTAPPSCGERQN